MRSQTGEIAETRPMIRPFKTYSTHVLREAANTAPSTATAASSRPAISRGFLSRSLR